MDSKQKLFLLVNAVQDKKLDVRVVERNMVRGVLSPDELERHKKSLPDDHGNAQWVSVESISGLE